MNILIDSRETKLVEIFKNNNIEYTQKQLELGDIQIIKDNDIILCIERKTIDDLIGSIKDGRYKEQKTRMLSKVNTNNILYIIEGKMDKYKHNEKQIIGSITNMNFRDKIKVITTNNINQTYDLILSLKKKFIEGLFNSKENKDYNETIKINKKENITIELFNIKVLATIPGVSVKMSEIIINKVNSIKELIQTYNDLDNEKDKVEYLKDIQYSEKRKIGLVISNRIYQYLCNIN